MVRLECINSNILVYVEHVPEAGLADGVGHAHSLYVHHFQTGVRPPHTQGTKVKSLQ